MTVPEFITATEDDHVDRYLFEEIRARADQWARGKIPPRFAEVTVTVSAVAEWVNGLIRTTLDSRRAAEPVLRRGGSLLLSGVTGTGKTHNAYGAMRAIQVSGVNCRWVVVHELEMFDRMRPRSGVDSEESFEEFANAELLVIDDWGTEVRTDWTAARSLRLVNYRYERMMPTLFTTNVKPTEFSARFGARVASRLDEMCTRVALDGPDRRKGGAW
jgi:DNA replication protein DnaC